ncbi:DCC1-like thiol-disulfide oxidoreductase family protein [Flavobacterium sp. WC2430]|uniref:DCC1-like thiol-disulfide oxidoreductase family protein n=1 Tax=Flavobacterium sp. WC2430 TaxID=3234137 RepID=UPI003465D142
MKKLTIFYDNFCPNCTKFSKFIQKLDWLKLIEIKELRNEFHTNSFRDIDIQLAKQQMASFDKKWHYGYNSLCFIFARLPLFWVFIPILYLLKITKLGQLMYCELALKRKIIPIHCDAEICDI